MKKYKVCVYAICKNEEKFINRWVESMKEADEIYVLDTGSTDNSRKLLKKLGVNVKKKVINPWRFDVARNESLKMVPLDADICVCTDIDEILLPGWRKELEKVWKKKTNRILYTYNWSLDENNNPLVSFYTEKIHDRKNYIWTHPIHEVLTYQGKKEYKVTTDSIVLNHYPDKEKSRSSYLPLLELSVKEDPEDDRNMHYLGREYMYYGKWNEAIDTLIKHLNLKSATWKDERCASMRFIARCYENLNRYDEAKMWLEKAINEAPYLRDPYVEMALLEYSLGNYDEVISNCQKALIISGHEKTYINEVFSYDHTINDLLSVSYYYKGDLSLALENVNKAISLSPNNERLKENKKIIEYKIKNTNLD